MSPERSDRELATAESTPLAGDSVGLLEGLTSTRAVRRYRDEAVPSEALRDILFAATRAPSGSNRQPFRFVVLIDGPKAHAAKTLIGGNARSFWGVKEAAEGYTESLAKDASSPKSRMAKSMSEYVENFESVPVLILPCYLRYRAAHVVEGASIYPACQNLLLAARALGYGGVMTSFHFGVEAELHSLLGLPEQVEIAATITLGRPKGAHGPVRRRPMNELVFEEEWGRSPAWAVDPPGTRYTGAGPKGTW
jgi:nitroreductase